MKTEFKKKLKIIGEIILVLSFLTQTLLFDYYNDKSNLLNDASRSRSLMDKGAEIKELKYFIAEFPNDTAATSQYREININYAAQKIAQSELMQIIGSNKSKKEKTDLSNKILQKSFKVKSFKEYMEFIKFLNKNSINTKDIISNIENINSKKLFWRKFFIFLYILGSIIMLLSIFIKEKTKVNN